MTKRNPRPRRVVRSLCLLGWLAIHCGSLPAANPESMSMSIPWRYDLRRAQAEARASDRLLWVQLTGSWCPNCVRLERESFVHPRIVAHARNAFVPVKLQAEDHEALVDRYGITGIPATLLIGPAGEVIARNEGYVDPATFRTFLEKALIRSGRSAARLSPSGLVRTSAVGTNRAPVSVPVSVSATAVEPRLALDGFCPVSLVEGHRLISGQPAMSLAHDGLVYRFHDDRMRQTFRKQPGRFLPVNGGRCPVTQVDQGEIRPGEARWSLLYKDHLYLCASEESRARFLKNPERYAHIAIADLQLCPHCWGRDGSLAQGPTSTSLAPTGWRTLPRVDVPIEAHRLGSVVVRR